MAGIIAHTVGVIAAAGAAFDTFRLGYETLGGDTGDGVIEQPRSLSLQADTLPSNATLKAVEIEYAANDTGGKFDVGIYDATDGWDNGDADLLWSTIIDLEQSNTSSFSNPSYPSEFTTTRYSFDVDFSAHSGKTVGIAFVKNAGSGIYRLRSQTSLSTNERNGNTQTTLPDPFAPTATQQNANSFYFFFEFQIPA